MDNAIIYNFDNKDDLYKSLGHQTIHNAARYCLINFYESHSGIEFIKAEIKILHNNANSEDLDVLIKTLFRTFFEGERDKTIVEAKWNKNNFTEPILSPPCHPEKDKWYRVPNSIIEKIGEKDKRLREVENELKRLNEEKEFTQKDSIDGMENSECALL